METNKILIGDARKQLKQLNSEIFDTCVTSPPYYGLRSYGVDGEIGKEPSPEEYIDNLVAVFREVKRVLKAGGTLWVNIGDSYAGSGKGGVKDDDTRKQVFARDERADATILRNVVPKNCKPKDLIGIPWMLAFALRADGWYLRNDIIWSKSSCIPEAVKDRCTRSHEYIFLLSKQRKYYYDYKAISEPATSRQVMLDRSAVQYNQSFDGGGFSDGARPTVNEDGLRNKRDVWTVCPSNYGAAHFAVFPPDLIRPCVLAGSRKGGLVLDPFAGAGTTWLVCKEEERDFIGIELNPAYAELATKRVNDSKPQYKLELEY